MSPNFGIEACTVHIYLLYIYKSLYFIYIYKFDENRINVFGSHCSKSMYLEVIAVLHYNKHDYVVHAHASKACVSSK